MKSISACEGIFLPVGQMLLIDRIVEADSNGIVCECDIDKHWVFDVHFPGDPIFPGSLLIEAAGQSIAVWMWENGMRGMPRLVRADAAFKRPVSPDCGTLTFAATVRRRRNVCAASVEVIVNQTSVAVVNATLMLLDTVQVTRR